MRLRGIRLVEQTEQQFRPIRAYLEEKQETSDCNGLTFLLTPITPC